MFDATFWTGVAAVGTVGTLVGALYQLELTRRDRRDDYLRRLIPFVSVELPGDMLASSAWILVTVYADGGGPAYNVILNLFPHPPDRVFVPRISVIRYLREGSPQTTQLPAGVNGPFIGRLEVNFLDVFSKPHQAWHTVNAASGALGTTDSINWSCKDCKVHPVPGAPGGFRRRLVRVVRHQPKSSS